ncbi:xanthine dehydrogenase accessory protein XdhC [Oceanomicrobium pacificus]|uniref:Xanthine dehydrogenase accessory protein XdhC n=1 Tax=Oceanomicrobium pacificus TaxID=2692916 RepID=A0A6B0TWA8_9RHOB|nr:xanthine dehydrogenase accessory protein XdhC [Oceanomicrobium pacificus]MXU65283.1 xanthine dehydrogenase accessory protein XdhC [Oceanomicrobium pacificus]
MTRDANPFDTQPLRDLVFRNGTVVRAVITSVAGSAPRGVGAAMIVWADGQSGTIGGGALELDVTDRARQMIREGGAWARQELSQPLGPALGQCCGGSVRVLLERFTADELPDLPADGVFTRQLVSGPPDPQQAPDGPLPHRADGQFSESVADGAVPVWIYGAGHVGRALVHCLSDLPFAVTWVDDAKARFPALVPAHATQLVAHDPADAAALAPDTAHHLIMTYSHGMDLELCHRLLGRKTASVGLIGSATKRARFEKRLRDLGHDETAIARLICPIGQKNLGKRPMAIAIGVAAELLAMQQKIGLQEQESVKETLLDPAHD